MLKRLGKLVSRSPVLAWTAAAVLLGPPLLLGLLVLAALVLRIELRVDAAKALYALAAVVALLIVFHLVRYWLRPDEAVTVAYDYELIQPALPLGRYTFRLEVYYHLEQKGRNVTIRQGRIEMRFRRRDHPDVLEWCCAQIAANVSKHRVLAAARYPDRHVVTGPTPTPRVLERGMRTVPVEETEPA